MTGVRFERDIEAFDGMHAVRLSNDAIEVVASTDYGPRILAYRYRESANVFAYLPASEHAKPTAFGEPWHVYGGHRLWQAPEDPVRTYVPDNAPVAADFDGTTLSLTPPIEAVTALVKELRVTVATHGSRVRVDHRLTNTGNETVRLAAWGLSVMAPGGQAVFPLPSYVPFPERLLPASRLVLWPYTRLADPRFRFGAHYLRLRQDPSAVAPQKVGILDEEHGWAAYANGDQLFVKRYAPARSAMPLVDLGCNVESFTDASMLELETLGPEVSLAPGATTTHREEWTLHRGVALPDDDEDAHRVLGPLLAAR